MIKTGEAFDRDENGDLWLCESWINKKTGETNTTRTRVFIDENGNEILGNKNKI